MNFLKSRMGFATLLVLLTVSYASAQAPKVTEEDVAFTAARKLFWSGRYPESEKAFKQYLEKHPGHDSAKSYLAMIAQSRKYDPEKIAKTEDRLNSIRVEKVVFKDTEWKVVCAYLQDLANPKAKKDKSNSDYINFINMLPHGYSPKLTLELKEKTLMEVVQQACQKMSVRFVVDTWAVIFDMPESKK